VRLVCSQEDAVIASALRAIPESPSIASEAVDVILIAKNLERVGDHATNIAEDVILISEARNVKHASKFAV
jgi:phosphate transport system protein